MMNPITINIIYNTVDNTLGPVVVSINVYTFVGIFQNNNNFQGLKCFIIKQMLTLFFPKQQFQNGP